MTTKERLLRVLLQGTSTGTMDDGEIFVRRYKNGRISVQGSRGELTSTALADFRRALDEAGYRETYTVNLEFGGIVMTPEKK